jgi:hypothetical protein
MSKNPGKARRRRWKLVGFAVVIFFIAAGYHFFLAPIQQSKKLEQALIDRYDWANRYMPPANGYIEPDRVEAFMQVRKAVQSNCDTFQAIFDSVLRIEDIDEDPDMSTGEKLSEVFGTVKSMYGAAPAFLVFMDARNEALLDQGMGIGEYMYIYLASYGPQLANEHNSRYVEQEDAFISHRARDEYIQILRNQLGALDLAGPETSHPQLKAALTGEVDRLKDSLESSPWPDGPPLATLESLMPYQPQIDELYCEGMVRVELLQKNRGLSFEG